MVKGRRSSIIHYRTSKFNLFSSESVYFYLTRVKNVEGRWLEKDDSEIDCVELGEKPMNLRMKVMTVAADCRVMHHSRQLSQCAFATEVVVLI